MAIIKIREQSGTDTGRKFDYQMAVALDYLLSNYNKDAIILIETLEDFAVLYDLNTDSEKIEIFQVKTKNNGLYTKDSLFEENVLGKIILTDIYFDSRADSLNIICNTNLKGKSTEMLDNFKFEDKLSLQELEKMRNNVSAYLRQQSINNNISIYTGKLIYIKSTLPFSNNDNRYSETLIGKTNTVVSQYLKNENHTINPQIIFNTLKLLIDKKRLVKYSTNNTIDLNDAINMKGITTSVVKSIIDTAVENQKLSKKDIFAYASKIFPPEEYLDMQDAYPRFLSYKANLEDKAFLEAKKIIKEEYRNLIKTIKNCSLDEIAVKVAKNCVSKIQYYDISVIQLITIIVIYE